MSVAKIPNTIFVIHISGGKVVNNPPANAGNTRDLDLIPGLGRSPEERNGNPLQYSCLGNSRERGACRATVYGAAKEQKNNKPCQESLYLDEQQGIRFPNITPNESRKWLKATNLYYLTHFLKVMIGKV